MPWYCFCTFSSHAANVYLSQTSGDRYAASLSPYFSCFSANDEFRFIPKEEALADFQSSLSYNFEQNLQLVCGLAQGDALVSVYSINLYFTPRKMTVNSTLYLRSQFYGECNCAISAFCTQLSTPAILGFLFDCSPLESFLQSTFKLKLSPNCAESDRLSLRSECVRSWNRSADVY